MLWRVLLEDAVLADSHGDGDPFALADGRRLWEALATERTLDELTDILGADESGLTDLLELLADAGVVERAPG